MKKLILILSIFLFALNTVYADQLAYISKTDAEKAAKVLVGKKAILYCGCCQSDNQIKIKILSTEVRYTNYENFYEVYISYINKNGEKITKPIDLAYVWIKDNGKVQTVGQILKLEHDPCSESIKWRI